MPSLNDLLAMLAPINQELACMGVTLTATQRGQTLQIPATNAGVVTCRECQHIFIEAPLCPKCGAMLDAESYFDGDDDDDQPGDPAPEPTADGNPREVLLDRPVFNHEYPEEVECEACGGRGTFPIGDFGIDCEECGGRGYRW